MQRNSRVLTPLPGKTLFVGKPRHIPRTWQPGVVRSFSISLCHFPIKSRLWGPTTAREEPPSPLCISNERQRPIGLGCLLAQFGSQPTYFTKTNCLAGPLCFCVSLCDAKASLFPQCVHVVCVLDSYICIYLWASPTLSYLVLDLSPFELRGASHGTKSTDLTCNVSPLTCVHQWATPT